MATFGNETVTTAQWSIEDVIRGGIFTTGDEYTQLQADSISAYLYDTASVARKAALYDSSKNLVGGTEEVTSQGSPSWIVFSFEDPKPILDPSTNYYIVVWCGYVTGTHTLRYDSNGAVNDYYMATAYGSWPETLNTTASPAWTPGIYCTYSEYVEEKPLTFSGSGKLNFIGGNKELVFTTLE